MISRIEVLRGTPYIVPGKSRPSWTAHSSSCRPGGNNWAGRPAATQPMGTTVSAGRWLLTCSTLPVRSSERARATAPAKIETPVATKTSSSMRRHSRVRADEYRVADDGRMLGPATQYRVLHDDDVLAEDHGATVAVEDRSMQHPCPGRSDTFPVITAVGAIQAAESMLLHRHRTCGVTPHSTRGRSGRAGRGA